jgi:phytoene dehydrogenase-like protein
MADAIIIGAGYAGMSMAALLANSGRKVIVLEASGMIGGRALSYRNEKGYVWEYGAHSHRLAHKGIANEVFKRLGEEIDFLPEAKDAKLTAIRKPSSKQKRASKTPYPPSSRILCLW